VPIHCASFCFRNSPEYIAWSAPSSRSTAPASSRPGSWIPDHPIMRGLEPFRTWDETYVHTKHNTKDRHVLQTRDDQAGSEPWTWTRTHGKGRVFYTRLRPRRPHPGATPASTTSSSAASAGPRARGMCTTPAPAWRRGSRRSSTSRPEVPLYTPGAKWGTLGEPIRKMQKPLSPEESQKAPRPAGRLGGRSCSSPSPRSSSRSR